MKYTPADLARMRHSIWDIRTSYSGRAYNQGDMERTVEAELVTHMMNETTPDELAAHAQDRLDAYWERERRAQEAAEAHKARASTAFVAIDYAGKKRWWHL